MASNEVPSPYSIRKLGESRSFPSPHAFLNGATEGGAFLVLLGDDAFSAAHEGKSVVVELGDALLEDWFLQTGRRARAGVLGFNRWRLGRNDASSAVELVVHDEADAAYIDAVRAAFEAAGLVVSICEDRAGRIIDRLLRPHFNLALQTVDDKRVTADDMETCLTLGLGYRNGVLRPLEAGGLEDHYRVTQALYEAYGQVQYLPARRAAAAHRAAQKGRDT